MWIGIFFASFFLFFNGGAKLSTSTPRMGNVFGTAIDGFFGYQLQLGFIASFSLFLEKLLDQSVLQTVKANDCYPAPFVEKFWQKRQQLTHQF